VTTAAEEIDVSSPHAWSRTSRIIASLLIAIYLTIVILGPMSNPIRSDNLSGPLSQIVAPFHQSLYLGHGYRFFGPDPGPSHLVYFKVTRTDGETVEGSFPDRNENWPRLLYHRWFMLSETLYEEHAFTPDQKGFDADQEALQKEIDKMKLAGEFELVNVLEAQRLDQTRRYENTRQRISQLVTALENHLLARHHGESVQLFLRERLLPEATETRIGVELDDPRYLSPLLPIGSAAENAPLETGPLPEPERAANGR